MPPNSNWNSVFNVQVGRFDGGWTFEFRVPVLVNPLPARPRPVLGLQRAARGARWKNEESHIVPLPLALGQRPRPDPDVAQPAPGGSGTAAASQEPRVPALRHRHAHHRPAGPPAAVQRPDAERGVGREVRPDAEPDDRPDRAHRLRAGRGGRATGEPDAVQPALPREAHVLPRRPGHLQLRHRRRSQHQRRGRADALLQPADRPQPGPAGANPRGRPRDGQGGRLPGGLSACRPGQAIGGGRFHQLHRGPRAPRHPAPQRLRRCCTPIVAVARRERAVGAPTAATSASASSTR